MGTDLARVPFYTSLQKKRRARECLFFMEEMMFNKDSTTTRREFVKRGGGVACSKKQDSFRPGGRPSQSLFSLLRMILLMLNCSRTSSQKRPPTMFTG